jgi:hypothetical protein
VGTKPMDLPADRQLLRIVRKAVFDSMISMQSISIKAW